MDGPHSGDSSFEPAASLLVTELHGRTSGPQVETWARTLTETLAQIPDFGRFKILVDLSAFEATDLEAHRVFREVVPGALAQCAWKVGYLDLFEREEQPELTSVRGVRCVAAAHVHHDRTKMAEYQERFGRRYERFFSGRAEAEAWMGTIRVEEVVLEIHVAQAILTTPGGILMQLRDNDPYIRWPWHWGLFGGHVDPGEEPLDAVRRELREELEYETRTVQPLETLVEDEVRRHLFVVPLEVNASKLHQKEGRDMRVMSRAEIESGSVYSEVEGQERPIVPNIRSALLRYLDANAG